MVVSMLLFIITFSIHFGSTLPELSLFCAGLRVFFPFSIHFGSTLPELCHGPNPTCLPDPFSIHFGSTLPELRCMRRATSGTCLSVSTSDRRCLNALHETSDEWHLPFSIHFGSTLPEPRVRTASHADR